MVRGGVGIAGQTLCGAKFTKLLRTRALDLDADVAATGQNVGLLEPDADELDTRVVEAAQRDALRQRFEQIDVLGVDDALDSADHVPVVQHVADAVRNAVVAVHDREVDGHDKALLIAMLDLVDAHARHELELTHEYLAVSRGVPPG
jgi:hypothetical protein